jgi:hydrogenase expression/formation protein HypD
LKYIDEYRNINVVKALSGRIRTIVKRPWKIMEICGGQTHAILKYNLTSFLPQEISLIHGPGCPVCVTPLEKIDKALHIAASPQVIFTSFGDMLRVPGSQSDLLKAKAEGADIRMVYSPLDAVKIAKENPHKKVVFFAIGFETTAPINALSVIMAKKLKLTNYSILSSHVLVPPAMDIILSAPDNRVQGFLAAGHVCSVMGFHQYHPIAQKFNIPMAVTGFEPVDILQGLLSVVTQLENGTSLVKNEYGRVVTEYGNVKAQESLWEVFEITDQTWRGIGNIPKSGLKIKKTYSDFDAESHFDLAGIRPEEPSICIAGQILQGKRKPMDCAAYGKSCIPERPLGAPMVSQEGACSAYYRYQHSPVWN